MLGIGNSLVTSSISGPGIVRDNLVLRHNYDTGLVQPVSDGAAYFVGSNTDYITMGDPTNLNMGEGSFSVSCWVNTVQTGATNFVVSKADGQSTAAGQDEGFALYLGDSGTDWVFWVSDGANRCLAQTTVAANTNQWYHVCGTFDKSGTDTATLYVDGVLIGSSAQALGDIDVTDNFLIGGAGTTYDWDGYVCNVGVWDAVLSQAQIKSIMWKKYSQLTSSETTDLVSWWNLDSVIPDTTTLVYDNHHDDGDTLGSELVTNGDFSNGTTGWSVSTSASSSNDVSVSVNASNQLVISSQGDSSSYGIAVQELATPTVVGNVYKVKIDILSVTGGAGATKIRVGTKPSAAAGSLSGGNIINDDSSFLGTGNVIYFTATSGQSHIAIGARNDITEMIIDNVSVKLVNGNTGTLS